MRFQFDGKWPPMIARSTVSFAELRQLLLDLGLTQSRQEEFWYFEHPPSRTVVIAAVCGK